MARLNVKHQSTAASTWWCSPRPHLGWVEMAVGLPDGPSYPGHFPHTNHFFAVLRPERQQLVSTQLFLNRSPVFSLLLPFSCTSSHSFPSPDERQRSSQPLHRLSLFSGRWKCDLAGQVSAMLHLLQMGSFKVPTTFPLQIQNSWQLSLLELFPLLHPYL